MDSGKQKQIYVPKQNVKQVLSGPMAASSGLSLAEKELIISSLDQDKVTNPVINSMVHDTVLPNSAVVQTGGLSKYIGKSKALQCADVSDALQQFLIQLVLALYPVHKFKL